MSENKDKDNKIIDFSNNESSGPVKQKLNQKAKSHIEDLKKNLVDNAVANLAKAEAEELADQVKAHKESLIDIDEAVKLVEQSNKNIQHTPAPQLSDEDCMRIADLVVSRLLNNSKEQQKHISIIERQVYDITSIAYAAAVGCTDILRSDEHEGELAITINKDRYKSYLDNEYSKGLTADHHDRDTVYFHMPHINEETGIHHSGRINKKTF